MKLPGGFFLLRIPDYRTTEKAPGFKKFLTIDINPGDSFDFDERQFFDTGKKQWVRCIFDLRVNHGAAIKPSPETHVRSGHEGKRRWVEIWSHSVAIALLPDDAKRIIKELQEALK